MRIVVSLHTTATAPQGVQILIFGRKHGQGTELNKKDIMQTYHIYYINNLNTTKGEHKGVHLIKLLQ
jgi:hypothetical protein